MSRENIEKVLYNHYGEENNLKIPEFSNLFSSKIDQIRNEHDRNLDRYKRQKKIQKDLYLRERFKVIKDFNRNAKSLKIEFNSKRNILRKSLSEIKKISNIQGLINFELKKVNLKIKQNSKYLDSSYTWIKRSSEEPKDKVKKLKKIIEKCKLKEKILFILKNSLIFLKVKNSKKHNFNDDIKDFSEKNWSTINSIEKNLNLELKNIIFKKEKKESSIKKEIEELKNQYIKHKKELYLLKNYKINSSEAKYNREYFILVGKNNDRKIKALSNISSMKSKDNSFKSNIILKKRSFILNQKNQLKKIKFFMNIDVEFRTNLYKLDQYLEKINIINTRMGSQKLNFNNIEKEILSSLRILESDLNSDNVGFENLSTAYKKNLKKKLDKNKLEINNKISFIKKEIQKKLNQSKNNIEKRKLKTLISDHFSMFGRIEKIILYKKRIINEWKLKIGQIIGQYSYQGDFIYKNANSYLEFVSDWNLELEKLNADRIKSKIDFIDKKNHIDSKNNHLNFKKKKEEIKKKWFIEINKEKLKLKDGKITKLAYKQKKKEYKIYSKEEVFEEKFNDDLKKSKATYSSFKFRYFGKRKIWKKVYESKIVENKKATPIESFNFLRYLSAFLNLILPGLSELSIFRQYKKGALLISLSILMYSIMIPFIFGLNTSKFNGIFGIYDMGASTRDWINGVIPDARYYLLGAIISIFFLAGLTIYNLASAITAYKTGKIMEQGVRPMGWIHTRRWLSNQGFPWLISLPAWILILFIVCTPIFTSLLISFTNMGFNHEPPGKNVDWVGFEQYGKWWLFKDAGMGKSIWRVLQWSIIWTLLSSSLVIALGTFVAVVVNQNKVKFKKVWRLIYIIPWAIPAFVTIMFMKSAFQSDSSSLMNMVLLKMNIIDSPKDWMGRIWTVRIIIILLQGWLGHSYIFLLVTGNMQSIPKNVYEASQIDGANNNQMFRKITLPILIASIAPLLISQFTFNFNNFTIIALFSGGGPAYEDPTPFLEGGTDILISWIFKLTGFAKIDGNMAFSSAMTILASLISLSFASYGFAKSAAFRRY